MMNLKLNTNPDPEPAGHAGIKVLAGTHPVYSKPQPTIKLKSTSPPEAPAGIALFARLPANSCDVEGCRKYGHAFPSPQALMDHKRAAHQRRHNQHAPLLPPAAPEPVKLLESAQAEPVKKYKCKQCEASFDITWKLSQHVRWTHPKAKAPALPKPSGAISCPECQKTFKSRGGLAGHMQKHQSNKDTVPAGLPKEFAQHTQQHPEDSQCFLRFVGNKAQCANAAMLLIQNGYININLGSL
jgi:hypothetical protein